MYKYKWLMRNNNLKIGHKLLTYSLITIGQKICIYIWLYAVLYALQSYIYYTRLWIYIDMNIYIWLYKLIYHYFQLLK